MTSQATGIRPGVDPVLSIAQTAEVLNLSERSIWRLISDGRFERLEFLRAGVVFSRAKFAAFNPTLLPEKKARSAALPSLRIPG